MASRSFTRPENAISKAEEFMKVGKPTKALDTLYDVIKAKKNKHTVTEKLIESIMKKYLELCVDLKKSHVAKEGLYQYRNMCQATNVASLTNVVQEYLNNAEKRTDAAKQESVDKVEVDDLDILTTPEMIMLSAVSGEGVQDRSDRTILMPWVKFLWESYCQCLELLRTNPRVERLYHSIAMQAFKFCSKYQRKAEFRKLCEKLRNHLDLISKQTTTGNMMYINLNNAETQQLNLDTRLCQLEVAITMELWQEAYKAVEDIHSLMGLSKRVFQPRMMSHYYYKLSLVFWKSGNQLFHAAATFKHFQLVREMKKNLQPEDAAKMASKVLAACLCVPLPSNHPEFDRFIETERSPAEKMAKLANLLGLAQPPTRASLLKDCSRFGIVSLASQDLQDMYNWMEEDFQPLKLCKRMDDKLKEFEATPDHPLNQYCQNLRDMTLVRLLKQVAQVYQSLTISRLVELAHFSTPHQVERVIVECARNNDMQVRIDHRTGTVKFGTDLSEAQRQDLPEGPHVQSMPSEAIRTQLMRMMVSLDMAVGTIYPDRNQVENLELRKKIVDTYHMRKSAEHKKLLDRYHTIEKRKEYLEKCNNEAMKERQKQIEIQEREKRKQEEQRLKEEKEKREKRRKEEEILALKEKQTQDRIRQLKETNIGKKVLDKLDEEEIAKMDHEQIVAKQVEELNKEKKELQVRLKAQEKKIDHMERAKRVVEIPMLKEQWFNEEKERIKNEKEQRELDMASKVRLERMEEDRGVYMESLIQERRTIFEKKLKEFEASYNEERAARLEARRIARVKERKRAWYQAKEEEEERKRQEEELKRREEEEKIAAEKRRIAAEEEKARQAKLDEMEEKKRRREAEIEERNRREEEERAARERESAGKYRAGPPKSGWRDREMAKEEKYALQSRDDERSRFGPSKSPMRGGDRGPSPSRRRFGGGDRSPPRGGGGDRGGSWRSGPSDDRSDDRPRGYGGPRRDDRDGPRRDDRDGPRRDDRDRFAPKRDDRDGPRRDDRDGPRRDDRDGPRRDDRDGPRRDDRDGPRRNDRDRDGYRGGGGGGRFDRNDRRGGAGSSGGADTDNWRR